MKKLTYLIISLLFISCSAQKKILLESTFNLQKPTKSIEEIRYYTSPINDSISKKKISGYSLYEFDNSGNLTLRKEYDSNKKLTKKNITDYDYKNLIYTEFEYKNEDSLNIYSKSDYTVGTNMKASSVVHHLSNGDVLFESEFTYDSKKNKVKEIELENGHQTVIIWENIYDGKNLIERKEFLNGSTKFSKTLFEYNNLGNLSNKKWINQSGKTVFDDSFEYDLFGNVTVNIQKNNKSTFQYKYDKFNNWIERIEYKNGEPSILTERKLKY